MTITSTTFGALEFSLRGTHVFLDETQICDGGRFLGATVTAPPETLSSVVNKWHRQRVKVLCAYYNTPDQTALASYIGDMDEARTAYFAG